MFKTGLVTALVVAVNAGTEAEAIWDTSVNGPFNTNACMGTLSQFVIDARTTWDYMSDWLYCNNATYVALGISGNICGTYAAASWAWLSKTVGTAGLGMTFCFANPRWGPCYAFGGYTNTYLGYFVYRLFSAYSNCKTEANGGDKQNCSMHLINSVFDLGQTAWYSWIAKDYCIATTEAVGDEHESEAGFDFSTMDVCSYTEDEIYALAEEYGFDPSAVDPFLAEC